MASAKVKAGKPREEATGPVSDGFSAHETAARTVGGMF